MINSERFKTLTQSFIDGGIDDADAVELLQAIQESNNLRDQLRAQVAMHAVIERRYRKRSSAVNRRVHAALRDPSQKKGAITRIMDKLDPKAPKKKGGLRTPVQAPPPQPAPSRAWRPSRRFVAWVAAALVLALLVPIGLRRVLHPSATDDGAEAEWRTPPGAIPIAQAKPSADFALVRRAGKTLKLTKAHALLAGDVVTTFESNSITLTYPDSSSVTTAHETTLTLQPSALATEAGIGIELANGEIQADVAPQPDGRPMVVLTPHGKATIVGTRFTLSADAAQSRLDVSEGKVRLASALKEESVLVAQGHSATLSKGLTLDAAPATRDPAYWPFSAASPWNVPIGSAAQFVPVQSPHFDASKGVELIVDDYAIPIFIASPTDPERLIWRRTKDDAKHLHMPANATPDPSDMKLMNIIDARHYKVFELIGANVESDGSIRLGSNSYYNSLQQLGVYSDNRQHGTRIYGGSSMGGIVRKGELKSGIRHALGMGVVIAALNANALGGKPYVWPASNALMDWERMYGKSGNLHLGSLLAIPPGVDLRGIGIAPDSPAFEIARALQDYGAYIIEHSEQSDVDMKLYFEPSAKSDFPANFAADISIVLRQLKIVANNSASNVGGGGTPRRQLAPPFAAEFIEKKETPGQF